MTFYVIQNLIQLDLIKMHHHEDHYLYSSINLYRTLWNVLHNNKKIHMRMTITGNVTGMYACT